MEIKNYCLLENGNIEDCYYAPGHPRNIYKENGEWYLDYDERKENCIIMYHRRIVKFADKKEELK